MSCTPIIVAIDGPAAAGKSTVAKAIASRLGFALVDTGAIYRCVALDARRSGIEWTDDAGLASLLPKLAIDFHFENGTNRVILDGTDVSEEIRTPEISKGASTVSARPVVRAGLLDLQRRLAKASRLGAVLEGRDIGTVVFPNADLKLFITASDRVRAERRHKELVAKGADISLERVLADQVQRDKADSTRALAPLIASPDAKLLDTSEIGLERVVEIVLAQVRALIERTGKIAQ